MHVTHEVGPGRVAVLVLLGALGCSSPRRARTVSAADAAVKEASVETSACTLVFEEAGLPHRAGLLARERSTLENLVPMLGRGGRGSSGPVVLTPALLLTHLQGGPGTRPWIAAFAAGRCRAASAADERALTQALHTLLANPESTPSARVEAAMSLVLRGERNDGLGMLRALLTKVDPTGEQYKAAYYLAQAGDPSGFPQLVEALTGELVQNRIMAVRHVIGFRPYDGQLSVGFGQPKTTARELLIERLRDHEAMVRQEVPPALKELGVPDLAALLRPVIDSDPDVNVRVAAEAALAP